MSVQETLRPSLALRYRPARTTKAEAPGREREHARVTRARHRGARVSGPEERPAQPDAWVERRRSLSGQQKHLSGADQASQPPAIQLERPPRGSGPLARLGSVRAAAGVGRAPGGRASL
jgi:hypothetical protein